MSCILALRFSFQVITQYTKSILSGLEVGLALSRTLDWITARDLFQPK